MKKKQLLLIISLSGNSPSTLSFWKDTFSDTYISIAMSCRIYLYSPFINFKLSIHLNCPFPFCRGSFHVFLNNFPSSLKMCRLFNPPRCNCFFSGLPLLLLPF